MDSLKEMWNLVSNEIRKLLDSDVIYEVWFASLNLINYDGETVTLSASEFKKNTIEKKFGDLLQEAFRAVLGFDVNIVIVDPDSFAEPEPEVKPAEVTKSAEEFTFENFVVGESNRFAYNAALKVAQNPGVVYNPLFIWGSSGLGKTHLLCAIKEEILAHNPDTKINLLSGEDIINMVVYGIREDKMKSVHEKLRNCDVMLVDDIQFISRTQSTQEEFFHAFNTMKADNKQIVLVSDSTPKDIPVLDERLRTRFEQGLIADIQAPDFETRLAIVQRKAAYLGMSLPQDVAEFITNKIKTNIRQLEGAVKKIHALSSLEDSPINIAMAQNAIKDLASEGLPVNELVNKIIAETARTYGISVDDIVSKRKDNKTVKARQIAIYCIRECTELTQQEICEYFGGRDRTTIHYALEKTGPMVEKDSSLRRNVEDIIKNAKNPSVR